MPLFSLIFHCCHGLFTFFLFVFVQIINFDLANAMISKHFLELQVYMVSFVSNWFLVECHFDAVLIICLPQSLLTTATHDKITQTQAYFLVQIKEDQTIYLQIPLWPYKHPHIWKVHNCVILESVSLSSCILGDSCLSSFQSTVRNLLNSWFQLIHVFLIYHRFIDQRKDLS